MPTKVVDYYGEGSNFGANITYVYQGKARGLADTVYRVKDVDSDRFLVYLGDNLIPYDLKKFVDFKGSASILLAKVENPNRFGAAVIKDGNLVKLVEKPKEPISEYAVVGGLCFHQGSILHHIEVKPSWRGELEINYAIQGLITRGRKLIMKLLTAGGRTTGHRGTYSRLTSFCWSITPRGG